MFSAARNCWMNSTTSFKIMLWWLQTAVEVDKSMEECLKSRHKRFFTAKKFTKSFLSVNNMCLYWSACTCAIVGVLLTETVQDMAERTSEFPSHGSYTWISRSFTCCIANSTSFSLKLLTNPQENEYSVASMNTGVACCQQNYELLFFQMQHEILCIHKSSQVVHFFCSQ